VLVQALRCGAPYTSTLDVMDMAIALSLAAALVVANGLATRIALRDPYTECHQKLFQCVAVWLVPVFGAIFVFALHRKPEKPTGRYRESLDPPWDDVTTTRGVGHSIRTHAGDQP
jgi:hypothetical protein